MAMVLCCWLGPLFVGLVKEGGGVEDPAAGLADDLLHSIKQFRELELGMLEAEVLARLIDGRRTSNELVLEIFGTARERSGFIADYNRVRRALKNLERRGFVSAPLLSKEKAYRLTRHGVACLTRIGGVEWPSPRVIPTRDRVLYAGSLLLAVATVFASRSGVLPGAWDSYLAGAFLISVGGSLVRLLETVWSVA